jgi:hypothetical protein
VLPWGLVLGGVLQLACGADTLVPACRRCDEQEVCVEGDCRARCETSRDCPEGQACHPELGYCVGLEGATCRDGGSRPTCQVALGEKLLAHACQHGALGPFQDVEAAPLGGAAPPTVDAPHYVYRASLTDGEGELAYSPTRPGEHALFLSPDVPLEVLRAEDGAPVAPVHEEAVEADSCPGFARGRVLLLEEGADYRLLVRGAPQAAVHVFFEHLDTFSEPWREVCR